MLNKIMDFFSSIKQNEINLDDLLVKVIFSLLDFIIGILIIYLITKIIIYFINKILYRTQKAKGSNDKRIETITSIIDNLIKYTMGIVMFLFVLISLGVSWSSLLAATGVIGVVLGLGANELIKDTINGFFVVFEGTYDLGEYVIINNYEGYVIDLGIKSTILKTMSNEKITIPNSKVNEVINLSKKDYVSFYYFSSSYDEKIEKMESIINEQILKEIKKLKIVKEVTYLGLDEFLDSGINYALKIKTHPEDRFEAKRKVNVIIKKIFDKENLEIPYQNITISYKKEN